MPKVVFIGSKSLGLRCLETIYKVAPSTLSGVVSIDDSSDTRTVLDQFRSFSEARNIPFEVGRNRRDSERLILDLKPDICLACGWYWMITPETLKQVSGRFLGLHPSLLPKYRGAAPVVWAMMNGEREVGFSLFSITEGFDDGPLFGQRSVPVQENDYIGDVLRKLEDEAENFFTNLWTSILEGTVEPVPQDHSQATFSSFRTPEDGQIDWTRPAKQVYNFIRAQSSPYPGAYTSIDGTRKLSVWKAHPADLSYFGTPGQIAQIREDGVYVICGDHRPLLLKEISLENEGRVAPKNVLKSLKTRLGPLIAQPNSHGRPSKETRT